MTLYIIVGSMKYKVVRIPNPEPSRRESGGEEQETRTERLD